MKRRQREMLLSGQIEGYTKTSINICKNINLILKYK